jgi:hypothetical protein
MLTLQCSQEVIRLKGYYCALVQPKVLIHSSRWGWLNDETQYRMSKVGFEVSKDSEFLEELHDSSRRANSQLAIFVDG